MRIHYEVAAINTSYARLSCEVVTSLLSVCHDSVATEVKCENSRLWRFACWCSHTLTMLTASWSRCWHRVMFVKHRDELVVRSWWVRDELDVLCVRSCLFADRRKVLNMFKTLGNIVRYWIEHVLYPCRARASLQCGRVLRTTLAITSGSICYTT
jgi:hypothetical protein